jgi:DNA-binding HxlR family transcriptional regulator
MADKVVKKREETIFSEEELCRRTFVLAITDTMNVVSGKWKLPIVCTLLSGEKSFSEIERLLQTVTPRMLSRELRELELNGVIVRMSAHLGVLSKPKYALTRSGTEIESVIVAMATWGKSHRALSIDGNTGNSSIEHGEGQAEK